MEPESEREALGDRVERASERASGLSSREKYGALSLTLNVSAKRGGDGGAAQRNAVAREARRRAGSPAPAPAVCCCPASCLVPLYPSQSRLPSSENASSPSPSPPFPFSLSLAPHPESSLLQSGENVQDPLARDALQQRHERLRLNDGPSLSLSICP